MEENPKQVFTIATANDIEGLPLELMGRFDRTFFLDLPNEVERRQIFLIHLKRAGVAFPERSLRLNELVEASRGFVGREIEQPDLDAALAEVVPISKSHAGVIEDLQKWKKEGLASPASSEESRSPAGKGRIIETA
jgi:SpoVK/Ycf46/Vps4 family AAA+-type ATPase